MHKQLKIYRSIGGAIEIEHNCDWHVDPQIDEET